MYKTVQIAGLALLLVSAAGCTPEVGSEAWCQKMDEKPKGDWSMNEASDYAKHCIFRKSDQND